jgi:RNA:NAD 2'-phosphotransferase (TPT1/KptA family)
LIPLPLNEYSPDLLQRLRRLHLIDDNGGLPELDERLPAEIQAAVLALDGARPAIRLWIDSRSPGRPLPLTGLLVVLTQMRRQPSVASAYFSGLGTDFAAELSACSLEAARALHSASRVHFGSTNLDVAVNAALEAQREFLFAVTSGRLSDSERTEALGKYAVSVALVARWSRPDVQVLRRAYEFQSDSIAKGNDGPQAYAYLVELLGEIFNQTNDETALGEALQIAGSRDLRLAEAELLLKRGLLRAERGASGSIPDLQRASQLAAAAPALNGVEYVQRALVQLLALSAILGNRPLGCGQVRLPYGFLQELPGLSPERFATTQIIVEDALTPMRKELRDRGARPNLVAQQVLTAIYRQSLERSRFLTSATAEKLVEVAEETAIAMPGSRHLEWQYADALLAKAMTTHDEADVRASESVSRWLVEAHTSWPLPRVTLARSLQLVAQLGEGSGSAAIEIACAWTDAVSLATSSAEFRRADLGGRSGVFAVDDARGDLSLTLVFKPVITEEVGLREADQLQALHKAIVSLDAEARFAVPTSLGVFRATNDKWVHVTERVSGTLLSGFRPDHASRYLGECASLLALFHKSITAPQPPGNGWKPLRKGLKLWFGSLIPEAGIADKMVEQLRLTLPQGLPLVRKRDSHPGNWLIDTAGRVVAIDLDSPVMIPIGHDFVQLIEDGGLLPVSDQGFGVRYALFRKYLISAGIELEDSEVDIVYDWFALYRSIWTATSSIASKAQHSHARQLALHIASTRGGGSLGEVAGAVVGAMRSVSAGGKRSELTGAQRRISKSMSKVLRHGAVEARLEPDDGGFVYLAGLARTIRQEVDVVIEIATHPAEPRFQVVDDRIRALYGHSFAVTDLFEVNVELPEMLFHGSSWDHLTEIAASGLLPQSRQHVHLTNNPAEAIEVARRHGHAILLAVATSTINSLRAVADAVWAAPQVEAANVRVLNAFAELPISPDWLAETPR